MNKENETINNKQNEVKTILTKEEENIFDILNLFYQVNLEKKAKNNNIDLRGKNEQRILKLSYYLSAWYYTLHGEKIFNREFDYQAWSDGPVNKAFWKLLNEKHYRAEADFDQWMKNAGIINENRVFSKKEIDAANFIIKYYGKDTDYQLIFTSKVTPWKNSREKIER